MEKSKAGKSPWVNKKKQTGSKKEEKAPFFQAKEKKPYRKRQRLLVWPNAFDKLGSLLKISSFKIPLEQVA